MFNELISRLQTSNESNKDFSKLNILEISIGCGNNFEFYPKDSEITGIEPNSLCENHAWRRLNVINNVSKKNITIKNYFIGFPEMMSCIRSDSMDLVLSTNAFIEDFEQATSEIHRILKKGGLFVYLEPRMDRQQNTSKYYLKSLFNLFMTKTDRLVESFDESLSRSQFAKEDKILVQRVFEDRVYGIAIK